MDPFVLLVLLFLCGAASAEDVRSVNPGDDAILPCQSADHIRAVEWTRTDLKSEYVLFYRDGHLQQRKQHPFFQGRVQLVDRDLKDRDVSLILKNVSSSDEGTYECRVKGDDSTRKKRSILKTEPIRRIRLKLPGSDDAAMKDGDKKDGGHTHIYFGVTAAVLFLVCSSLVGLFVFRKYKEKKPEAAAADKAEMTMLQTRPVTDLTCDSPDMLQTRHVTDQTCYRPDL